MVTQNNDSPGDAGASSPTDQASGGVRYASTWQVRLLGIGIGVLALLLAYVLISIWPSTTVDPAICGPRKVCLLGFSDVQLPITPDAQLILMVMVAGGLGSLIHTATSFTDFVGNEKFTRSWIWWYLLKPFIGMALALIFYLVVRGGFLSVAASPDQINAYGVAALAGLAGMFSKQATDKLGETFTTLFRTAPGGGDAKRKDDLSNLVPILRDVDPKSIEPATQNFVVDVKGSNFVKGSVVRIKGVNRETEFKDESRLIAKLLPDDLINEGELDVTVFNPPPGGGVSTPLKIRVAPKAVAQIPGVRRE